MSLYFEAAGLLENSDGKAGSLKPRVYGRKDLKSSPGALFALVTEASKWSGVLKEVVEKSELLRLERKVGQYRVPQIFQRIMPSLEMAHFHLTRS